MRQTLRPFLLVVLLASNLATDQAPESPGQVPARSAAPVPHHAPDETSTAVAADSAAGDVAALERPGNGTESAAEAIVPYINPLDMVRQQVLRLSLQDAQGKEGGEPQEQDDAEGDNETPEDADDQSPAEDQRLHDTAH